MLEVCFKTGRGRGRGGEYIPIPREATSVATIIGLLPVLNWSRTQSRSFCCLSPWIAETRDQLGNDLNLVEKQLTKSGPTILAQESSNVISNTLGAGKDEDFVLVILILHDLLKVLDHAVALL